MFSKQPLAPSSARQCTTGNVGGVSGKVPLPTYRVLLCSFKSPTYKQQVSIMHDNTEALMTAITVIFFH